MITILDTMNITLHKFLKNTSEDIIAPAEEVILQTKASVREIQVFLH